MNLRKLNLLCLLLAVLLCGCGQGAPVQTTDAVTTAPIETTVAPDPAAIYKEAAARLENQEEVLLSVTGNRTVSIGGQQFTSETKQTVTYLRRGDALLAALEEELSYGDYAVEIREVYADGIRYITMPEGCFKTAPDAQSHTDALLPPVLLDSSVYGSVTLEENENSIRFSEPTRVEGWLAPPEASVQEAEGTAELDQAGNITGYRFRCAFTYGNADYEQTVEVQLSQPENTDITVPEDADSYHTIECPDALRLFEQAYGYLLQAEVATSTNLTQISSYAAGLVSNRSTTLDMHGDSYKVQQQTNQSLSGQPQSFRQEELFRDGKYTVSVDGGDATENGTVDLQIMEDYCREMLVENLVSPGYFTDAVCTDLGGSYLIEFTGSEKLGEDLCRSICYKIFDDPELLNDLATDYKTMGMETYLAIDKYSGLPTAVGTNYSGLHTISGAMYLLNMQMDQSFDLASQGAYKEIYGQLQPETRPENTATPLFYRVSGENGQQMWLLGTIHVGDERTGFLPQEIYDAFGSSDALAVECLNEAFEKALDEDEELQAAVSKAYFYTDGTFTADHIADSELYDAAVKLMKASGSYFYNSSMLKTALWWQSLDNFQLERGYRLTSHQGVEERLLALAKEQDKQIREVESALFQLQMLTGYSDALQEELLLGTVTADPLQEQAATLELYEAWCRGDEAELSQLLTDDTSELTQEELALYNEYNTAMLTDRNANMAKVAQAYLESGDTVFYAVGLAHLMGEDGLVALLRQAGYTVEAVVYH